jgi:hypothetical protein
MLQTQNPYSRERIDALMPEDGKPMPHSTGTTPQLLQLQYMSTIL